MESSFETEEELQSQYRQIGAIHEYEPPPAGATRIDHASWKLKMNRKLDKRKRQLEQDNELKMRCVEAGKPEVYEPGSPDESSPSRKRRIKRIGEAIASADEKRRKKDDSKNVPVKYEFMKFVNRARTSEGVNKVNKQISDAERDAKKMDQRFRVDNSNRFRIDACAICDRIIKGTAKSCFISIEDLKLKADCIIYIYIN